jgi:hypothetical protein
VRELFDLGCLSGYDEDHRVCAEAVVLRVDSNKSVNFDLLVLWD